MKDMLAAAGFTDIKIEVKENAADIIKDWMPGSGAENYITSAYVTASKPIGQPSIRDDVRADTNSSCCPDIAVAEELCCPENPSAPPEAPPAKSTSAGC